MFYIGRNVWNTSINLAPLIYLFVCLLIYKVSLQELEQRRPLLERQVTAAQNLKNKTSNQDTRNAITERSMSHAFTNLFCEKLSFLLRNIGICYQKTASLSILASHM